MARELAADATARRNRCALRRDSARVGAVGPTTGAALALGLVGVVEEEFLYRGVPQSKLERVVSQERAWILSGLLFGLSHVPNDFFGAFWVVDGGDPLVATLRLTQQIAAGLLYGLFYAKSRSLVAPVFAHLFSNKLAAIVSTVWG